MITVGSNFLWQCLCFNSILLYTNLCLLPCVWVCGRWELGQWMLVAVLHHKRSASIRIGIIILALSKSFVKNLSPVMRVTLLFCISRGHNALHYCSHVFVYHYSSCEQH